MEADAQQEQRTIYRDQNQRARRNPGQLQYRAALRRAERKPGHVSQNRDPKVPQLAERRKRAVQLHHQQRRSKTGADAESEHERHEKRSVRGGRDNRHLRRIDNVELDLLGLGISRIGDLGGLAPRHELLVILLEDAVVAVEILRLHPYPRSRLRDLLDLCLIVLSLAQTALQGGDRGLGVDQLDLDLLVDDVGYLTRAASTAPCAPAGLPRLGLELRYRLPGGPDVRMVLGIFQQHPVEISPE